MKALVFAIGVVLIGGRDLSARGEDQGTPPSAGQAQARPIGQVTVLDLKGRARGPIKFCSRSSVKVSGYWTPTPGDIRACDAAAGEYLAPATKRLPGPFAEYHRQYFGFASEGRRLLYLNAYYSNNVEGAKRRKDLVNICDGGDMAWGLVCDPSTRGISEFEKNGHF